MITGLVWALLELKVSKLVVARTFGDWNIFLENEAKELLFLLHSNL
jgi:hypothetical protein